MSKKILLLGITDSVLANAQQQLTREGLEVFLGKVWTMCGPGFRTLPSIMSSSGEGELRKPTWRSRGKYAQASETTTVHLQDRSGPEGFLPFVQAVLRGLVPDEG